MGVNLRAISANELFSQLDKTLLCVLSLSCRTLLKGECPECVIHGPDASLRRLFRQTRALLGSCCLRLLGKLPSLTRLPAADSLPKPSAMVAEGKQHTI
jgi:hypothetical protein